MEHQLIMTTQMEMTLLEVMVLMEIKLMLIAQIVIKVSVQILMEVTLLIAASIVVMALIAHRKIIVLQIGIILCLIARKAPILTMNSMHVLLANKAVQSVGAVQIVFTVRIMPLSFGLTLAIAVLTRHALLAVLSTLIILQMRLSAKTALMVADLAHLVNTSPISQ